MEPFCPANGSVRNDEHVANPDSQLFHVKRYLKPDGTRIGLIVSLTDVWRQIDLIPYFGSKCPGQWASQTAVERAKEFIVNTFFDKEIFASMS